MLKWKQEYHYWRAEGNNNQSFKIHCDYLNTYSQSWKLYRKDINNYEHEIGKFDTFSKAKNCAEMLND